MTTESTALKNLAEITRQNILLAEQLGRMIQDRTERCDALARCLCLLIDTMTTEWSDSAEELREIKAFVTGSIITRKGSDATCTISLIAETSEAILVRMIAKLNAATSTKQSPP
jgi:hypothetical protein